MGSNAGVEFERFLQIWGGNVWTKPKQHVAFLEALYGGDITKAIKGQLGKIFLILAGKYAGRQDPRSLFGETVILTSDSTGVSTINLTRLSELAYDKSLEKYLLGQHNIGPKAVAKLRDFVARCRRASIV